MSLAGVGLSKRYGNLLVLDDVDFTVAPGDAVGIVGPNGAGKTTLLNVLSGALAPDTGAVVFRGRSVTSRGAADRCKMGIARTHQVPRPFTGMSVFENVFVGATAGGRARSCARDLDDSCRGRPCLVKTKANGCPVGCGDRLGGDTHLDHGRRGGAGGL